MFIKLTSCYGGTKMYFNIDHIISFNLGSSGTFTYLELGGDSNRDVKETPEEILAMIDSMMGAISC